MTELVSLVATLAGLCWGALAVAIFACLGLDFFRDEFDERGWNGLTASIVDVVLWPVSLWRGRDFGDGEW